MSDSGVYNGLGRSCVRTFLDQKKSVWPSPFGKWCAPAYAECQKEVRQLVLVIILNVG